MLYEIFGKMFVFIFLINDITKILVSVVDFPLHFLSGVASSGEYHSYSSTSALDGDAGL